MVHKLSYALRKYIKVIGLQVKIPRSAAMIQNSRTTTEVEADHDAAWSVGKMMIGLFLPKYSYAGVPCFSKNKIAGCCTWET